MPTQDTPAPDTPMLFLVVDAIPLRVAQAVWREGFLTDFAEPLPMISVFPSLTNVAVPALLRGVIDVRPPGYEARYFHPPTRTLQGGMGQPDAEVGFRPYRTLFEHPSHSDTRLGALVDQGRGALSHVAVYLLRRRLAWREIRWVRWNFPRQDGTWLGYLSATDGIAHFDGEQALVEAFRDICQQVQRLREAHEQRHGVRPGVVLCSDHGADFGELRHLDVREIQARLELAGYTLNAPGPRAVWMAPVGDVSAGALWCDPAQAPTIAQLIAELPGVDLSVCRTEAGYRVLAVRQGGLAEAEVLVDGARYRYRDLRGDPLQLRGVLEAGWLSDAAVFSATWDHRYPDPLHRIHQGLTTLVDWPAPVLFSMEDGWTCGPSLTHIAAEALGGQQGTHGALSRQQSTGFVLSTHPPVPRPCALRAEEVFRPFAERVRSGQDA
jgi:hypothetical protein